MHDDPLQQSAPVAKRGQGRRKAALRLLLLLGLPLMLLCSVFLTGAYWGSSKCPAWLLEKEDAWLGWKAEPQALAAAQMLRNRRNGLGTASSVITPPDPPSAQPSQAPVDSPKPKPEATKDPKSADNGPGAKAPSPSEAEQPKADPAKVDPPPKVAAVPRPARPALDDLAKQEDQAALAVPDLGQMQAQKGQGERATTLKDRFELPAKVGVMLVVDAQAFSGEDSCQRARSALHSANMKYRAWLNLSLDARGCLPWVAKSEQPKARGQALAALDLPGTDLLLVVTRPGRISMPALEIEKDVFNAGLALAQVPGGADDAAMRRAMMHGVGVAMGAVPIATPGHPDARRGSVMSAQPQGRKDWLDEPNRWRLLERKQWPFARHRQNGGR